VRPGPGAALLALTLCACAPEPEPVKPDLVLDCSRGFDVLSAAASAQPGFSLAPKERGEPFHYLNAADGQISFMVTEPGAPGHPAILMQKVDRSVSPPRIVTTGCPYGDPAGYAQLVAYLDSLAKARGK